MSEKTRQGEQYMLRTHITDALLNSPLMVEDARACLERAIAGAETVLLDRAEQLGYSAGMEAGACAADDLTANQARERLFKINVGDESVLDELPRTPDLSGEWADAPTPASVLRQIGSIHADEDEGFTAELLNRWEEGAHNGHERACLDALRARAKKGA